MKKILFLFIALLFVVPVSYSQTNEEITVKTSDLTPDQLAKIKTEQETAKLQKKIDTYGSWVGVGGEVGTAVREGLNAVVDVSEKFGKTDVGKFTMVLVAWKVIGKDITRIFIGLLFFAMLIPFTIYSFKTTCIERRVVVRDEGWFKPKEYEIIQPRFGNDEGLGLIRVLHIFFLFGGIGLTYAIMFA